LKDQQTIKGVKVGEQFQNDLSSDWSYFPDFNVKINNFLSILYWFLHLLFQFNIYSNVSEYLTLVSNVERVSQLGRNTIAEFKAQLGRKFSLVGN
jgi:hypothetical protein